MTGDERFRLSCRRIVGGSGAGPLLATSQPINFLAMVDRATGKIIEPKHDLYGASIRGSVLSYPYAIGSSVGAYAFYSLQKSGCAPAAIICAKADIVTASGCAIARIPLVDCAQPFPHSWADQGNNRLMVMVDADAGTIIGKV